MHTGEIVLHTGMIVLLSDRPKPYSTHTHMMQFKPRDRPKNFAAIIAPLVELEQGYEVYASLI